MKTTTMKSMKNLLGTLAVISVPTMASAQNFLADLSTRTTLTGSPVDRLWLDSGFTIPAPIGSRLWIVADTDGNGLPAFGPTVEPSLVLGPGDQIIHVDAVDGSIVGSNPGSIQRTVTVDNSVSPLNLYALLWGSGTPTTEGEVLGGNTFGVYSFGVRPNPFPDPGNANWAIDANINGSQFTVVPEPSSALYVGVGLAALAFLRKRFGKKATV